MKNWSLGAIIGYSILGSVILAIGYVIFTLWSIGMERERTFVARCMETGMTEQQCTWVKANTRQ